VPSGGGDDDDGNDKLHQSDLHGLQKLPLSDQFDWHIPIYAKDYKVSEHTYFSHFPYLHYRSNEHNSS
jgi:hypothetical protein